MASVMRHAPLAHREHIKAKLKLESSAALARHAAEWVETDEVST